MNLFLFRYDANVSYIIQKIVHRLEFEIDEYRLKIINGQKDEHAIDIPFGDAYQRLIQKHDPKTLISLILHADGVSVTRSTKLKMWLLSGVIVEIPPHLRNHRRNMVPISIWVGYVEPIANIWLQRCINNLKLIKAQGMNFFFVHHPFILD